MTFLVEKTWALRNAGDTFEQTAYGVPSVGASRISTKPVGDENVNFSVHVRTKERGVDVALLDFPVKLGSVGEEESECRHARYWSESFVVVKTCRHMKTFNDPTNFTCIISFDHCNTTKGDGFESRR
jgi:hypothetical protein